MWRWRSRRRTPGFLLSATSHAPQRGAGRLDRKDCDAMTGTPSGTVPSDPATDAAAVLDLLTGGWVAQTLRAVALLHVADHLADGAATAEEVAKREGSDPQTTYRLMRAASSLGVFSYEGHRRFGLTGRGQLLRVDVPGSLRSLVLVENEHAHWRSWEHFPEAV